MRIIAIAVAIGLVGGLCGYSLREDPADRPGAAVGAAIWFTLAALAVGGLMHAARRSTRVRKVVVWSRIAMAVSGVVFILLLGATGGGLSRGPVDQYGPVVQFIAGLIFLASIPVAIISFVVWMVVGLPISLGALPVVEPEDLASATRRAPRRSGAPSGLPLTSETRELLGKEFGRQRYGALRIPAATAIALSVFAFAPGRSGISVRPLDPDWVPNDITVGALLAIVLLWGVAVVQFVTEERRRRQDLEGETYRRSTGTLFTESGALRGGWSRQVFTDDDGSFVPVVRLSWRIWEWVGLESPIPEGRVTLDWTNEYHYVLAARDPDGELLYSVPGYDEPKASVKDLGASKAESSPPKASLIAILYSPVMLILIAGIAVDVFLISYRFR